MSNLLINPRETDAGEYIRVSPETAGWPKLHFCARRMCRGDIWEAATGDFEYGLVVLGGICSVQSSRGNWECIGRRPNVFSGMPHALYLPSQTTFSVRARSAELDLACGWCESSGIHPPQMVSPKSVAIEIRGGGNATRQINSIFPAGFDSHRLVAVEVYTPGGNWSSYPPHKHDEHRLDQNGNLVEADLEEIYFYKFNKPEGFAIQRVYTADRRLDETIVARNNDVVLVPEGYHPVVAAHGYNAYYLNFLAGSAQSLANSDDPAHAWIKDTWKDKDPRVPLVTMDMEKVK
ncbi:MAG: 5-deoxy-glucuronate isomerase [Verrucomicrobia bacterium]|nr:MAG: 5-deoxy-glucuronate isomerase [Verrucomicrobiota bacterium]